MINGKAVVPTAIITEWLAHGALHGNPGLLFHGFNNLKIYKGIILDGADCEAMLVPYQGLCHQTAEAMLVPYQGLCHQTARVSAFAGKAVRKDGFFAVPVELRGHNGELCLRQIFLGRVSAQPGRRLPEFASGPIPAPWSRLTATSFPRDDMRFIRSVAGFGKG